MQQPSDEIKSKLDIIDVIREYIPLKPAGVNFRALCPFHREKNPSFVVSPEKQIWHCFGCGKGGDVFSFIMEKEGLNFVEVLRLLAPKAGVALRRQNPKLASQRNRLLDIVDLSARYYNKVLLDSAQDKTTRQYLAGRGVSEEIIEEWQIGYAPDSWDDLLVFLKNKGFTENEIFLAGMIVKKEGTSRFYNRFRDRIMFPINDINGQVAAFSARVNPEKEEGEKLGKYINSPHTMIYDKSRILFGLDKAKASIKSQDLAIVVEGQMDVITAHKNGFKNIIASSGTALTTEQLILLKRYSNNIALAFDMDQAGQIAADRGIGEAMRQEMSIKIITTPQDKDPDECLRKDPDEWRAAVEAALPAMQYYFNKIFSSFNLDMVEDRRQAAKAILPIIAKLGNKIEEDFWLKKLSEKIDIGENILRETLQANMRQTGTERSDQGEAVPADTANKTRQSREEMLSELLLALIIKFPNLIDYIMDNIQTDQLVGQESKLIYRNLIIYYNSITDNQSYKKAEARAQINYNEFRVWLKDTLSLSSEKEGGSDQPTSSLSNIQLKLLDRLVLLGDKDFYDLDNEKAKNEAIKITVALKEHYLINRKKEIEKLIIKSEAEGETEKVKGLMEELKMLSDHIKEISNNIYKT